MPSLARLVVSSLLLACGGAQPPAEEPSLERPDSGRFDVLDAGSDGQTERAGAARRALIEEAAKYGIIGLSKDCAGRPDSGPMAYPCSIQRTIRASLERLHPCYKEGRKKKPDLEGEVTVRFVIDSEGHVIEAAKHDASTLPDDDVAQCVVHEFERLSFPPPPHVAASERVTIVYPITFSIKAKP
jgi:TonB family protein